MSKFKINIWVKALGVLLLMLNGNYPLVYFGYLLSEVQSRVLWIGIILFIIIYKLKQKIKIKPIFVLFYGTFLILIFVQNVYLKSFFFTEFINITLVFTISYVIIYAIGFQGLMYLPELTVKLIKLSLLFYVPTAISFLLGNKSIEAIQSIAFQANGSRIGTNITPLHTIIHNFSGVLGGYGDNSLVPRNSGMFWEPGAFAGIIIMMFLIMVIYKQYYNEKQFKNIIKWLIIGIISTFSTTGLLLIPVLILINFTRGKKISLSTAFKLLNLSIFIIFISVYSFNNIPVLKNKIEKQIEAVETQERGSETTRLGSMFLLINLINEEPIIGNGIAISSQQWRKLLKNSGYEFANVGIGNGMFLMLAWVGIPFFIFIFVMMGYNIRMENLSLGLTLVLIIVLLILLQGESWMKLPLIYIFCFIGVKKYKLHDIS